MQQVGRRVVTIAIPAALLAWAGYGQDAPAWPDTYLARVQAAALVETLNAELLASRSATLMLEAWCRDHRLAKEPAIVADVVKDAVAPATNEQRQRLQVGAHDEVKYRRVRLRCGERVLSEADNWYVPGRLTAEMNRALETTDAPFGKVVQPLQPYRQTFAVKLLWAPLPAGWENGPVPTGVPGGRMEIPEALFEHRALLYTSGGKAFSEVREVYQRHALAFPLPR